MHGLSPLPSEPTPERIVSPPLRWFLATRPAFLSVTLAGCLIGLATAHSDGVPFDVLGAIVTVVFALLAHAGANVLNDYQDALSASPAKLASRGLGEFAVAAAWLLVVVGADFVQRGSFAWTPVAAGMSFALLVANLLYINQFPDRTGDEAAGKRTLVVRLGADSAKWGYFAIALVAYGWLVLQVGRYNLPQACAAAALTLVLSFHAARLLREHAEEPAKLAPAIKLTILATNLHGFVLAATLAFGRHT